MAKFKRGDMVVLANPNTGLNLFGIDARHWNARALCKITDVGDLHSRNPAYIVSGPEGAVWSVYEDMIEGGGGPW